MLSTNSLPDLEPTKKYLQFHLPSDSPRLVHSYVTGKFHRSNIVLATQKHINNFYLDIRDVFNYVTQTSFADEYYDVLNNFICKEVYS